MSVENSPKARDIAVLGLEGRDALNALAGSSSEVPPLQVLFLVHRVRASGRLWMTRGVDMCAVDFSSGEIAGCTGFTSLIAGVEGERSWSVDEWAASLSTDADAEGREMVFRAICSACFRMGDAGDWMLNFVPGDAADGVAQGTPVLGKILSQTIVDEVSPDEVRAWFESTSSTGLVALRPADDNAADLGLDTKCMELLKAVEKGASTGALFVEIGSSGWSSLGVLWKLGLIAPRESSQPAAEAQSKVTQSDDEPAAPSRPKPRSPSSERRREQPRRAEAGPSNVPLSPDESTQERQRRQRSKDPSKRKRRRDPRVVAIKRDPGKSPSELVESHLKEAHDVLKSVRPEFVFRLKKVADLEREVIDRRHREACARYHPDRFRNSSQGVQALAEGCFTAVSEAFHRLIEPEYLEALRIKFVERETGTKVVTDKTRSRARVDFAKAEALFKQKRYADAHRMAVGAVEGDPDKWQYQYLQFRSGYRCGAMSMEVVEPGVLGLQGMTTVEKADQLYTLGELWLKDGDEDKAYKLFRQAVSLDGQNVGASRRLRLRDRRQRDEDDKSSSGGLFGGLFQRRK